MTCPPHGKGCPLKHTQQSGESRGLAAKPLCEQGLHSTTVHWSKVHCWHVHLQHVDVCCASREQDLENRLRRYFGANVTQSHLKMAEAPAGEQSCRGFDTNSQFLA